MLWAATAITFVGTIIVVMGFIYAFTPGGQLVAERLQHLWHPPSTDHEPGFREKQKERAQKALTNVGRLVPASGKAKSRTQRLMIRAGYRRPESIFAMQGAKLLLPIASVAAMYFSGFYRYNPFVLLPLAGFAGYAVPDLWLTWQVRRRQHRIRLSLADALDLLVVCVEAGLGLDQALLRVSQELRTTHPELCDELQLVNLEMRVGKVRIEALRELANRTGVDDIKALVAMLIQTDRFGTSLAQSLRVHSDTLRTKRRQRAEEAAAKAPVKMVPPLVFFIFPALFVVILGPAVISMARQMIPMLSR